MTLGGCMKLMLQCWPFEQRLTHVLSGYAALGSTYKATLADIALRNGVFATSDTGDQAALAYAAGRRDAALEIFQIASVDTAALYALVETKAKRP